MIYFDNAATTLHKPSAVGNAMRRAISEYSSPGRGGHSAAMKAAEISFKTREAISELFKVGEPENIIFCMNATHALNIAIKSLAGSGDRVVVSGYEHNSVTRPLYAIGADIVAVYSELFEPFEAVEAFRLALTPGTSLAVVNHTSNVFGYILPVAQIAELCRQRGIPFIIDASQSAGHMDIDFSSLGAAFMAMPGHKGLYGPQGTGILICDSNAQENQNIKTLMEGGSGGNSREITMPVVLPDRLEAGTHNMPGIAGLYEGIKFVKALGTQKILRHERELLKYAVKGLRNLDGVELYTSEAPDCQTGVLSLNINGMSSETAAEKLSERGIAVRAGLHCSPLAHKTVGTYKTGTIRASFSVFNTKQEVDFFISAINDIRKSGSHRS